MPKFTSADIEIKAKDKTKAGVGSAKKGIGGLTAAVKNYGAEMAAVYLVVKKAISIVKGLTEAYADQEVAETKLRSALAATGQLTYETEQALHSFASEMQSATGIGDELTIAAAGIMTTFTQISTDTFPEAIEAAANMSKMFGQDLQQSVIQLGTALNDPIAGVGRLKRIGISFSEDQKKSIELFMEQNDIMSAQRVILDELQLEIGGVARAYGETLAGQQDIVNQQFSDFKELLGGIVATNLPGYLAMASDLITSFTNIAEKVFSARLEIMRFKKTIGAMTIKELKEAREATDELAMANIREDQALVKLIASRELAGKKTKKQVKALAELHIEFNNLQARIDEYDKQIEIAEETQRKFNVTIEDGIDPIKRTTAAITDLWEKYGWTYEKIQETSEALKVYSERGGEAIDITNELNEAQVSLAHTFGEGPAIVGALTAAEQELLEMEEALKEFTLNQLKTSFVNSWDAMWMSAKDATKSMKDLMKDFISSFLRGMGRQFALLAVAAAIALQFGKMAKYIVLSAAFYAGAIAISRLQHGGKIEGYGGGDTKPAMLEPGEMVMTKEATRANQTTLEAMNAGGGGAGEMMHITIYFGSKMFYDDITKASRNREIRISRKGLVA